MVVNDRRRVVDNYTGSLGLREGQCKVWHIHASQQQQEKEGEELSEWALVVDHDD